MPPQMLAEKLLPDEAADTKPQCLSGVRRKVSENTIAFAEFADLAVRQAEDTISCLAKCPPGVLVDRLILALHKCRDESLRCRDEFDAWHMRTPTPGDRSRWIAAFLELHQESQRLQMQANCTLAGER